MHPFDWSHIQSFVAVAEHGSLSAAARATQNSQPTLSRHIAQLENEIGVRLFDRHKSGVTLTERGAAMMSYAAKMADAAAQVMTAVDEPSDVLAGTVRVTASQFVATYLLPDVLTALHLRYPQIEIELVASDITDNLLRREADIALRMYRPTQGDVISRHVGDLTMGAFAHRDYIARRGMPSGLENLAQHDLVGYDRSTLIIDGMKAMGLNADRRFFKFRCDDQVVCWQMVQAGFGVGFHQRQIAMKDPDVVCISGDDPVGILPVWLTAHRDVKHTPRIRKVYDHLARAIAEKL